MKVKLQELLESKMAQLRRERELEENRYKDIHEAIRLVGETPLSQVPPATNERWSTFFFLHLFAVQGCICCITLRCICVSYYERQTAWGAYQFQEQPLPLLRYISQTFGESAETSIFFVTVLQIIPVFYRIIKSAMVNEELLQHKIEKDFQNYVANLKRTEDAELSKV